MRTHAASREKRCWPPPSSTLPPDWLRVLFEAEAGGPDCLGGLDCLFTVLVLSMVYAPTSYISPRLLLVALLLAIENGLMLYFSFSNYASRSLYFSSCSSRIFW